MCAQLACSSPFGRFTALVAVSAYHWRHSLPTAYLLGEIGGQLVVLRRRGSTAVPGPPLERVTFESFSETFAGAEKSKRTRVAACARRLRDRVLRRRRWSWHRLSCNEESTSLATPGYLQSFFSLRDRGLLRLTLPLATTTDGDPGRVHVINTHLPHLTDNTALLGRVADLTSTLCKSGTVVLAGDFNPLPDVSLPAQLAPLLDAGAVPTTELEPRDVAKTRSKAPSAAAQPDATSLPTGAAGVLHTWDCDQPLTRKEVETPVSGGGENPPPSFRSRPKPLQS